MSRVYLVFDERAGRRLVLKVLKESRTDKSSVSSLVLRQRKRFLREYRVGAEGRHPNVAATYDLLTGPRFMAFTMEHYAGGDLGYWCELSSRTPGAVTTKRLESGPSPSLVHAPPSPALSAMSAMSSSPLSPASSSFSSVLSPQYVAAIGILICRALDYGHSRGCVHNDLKPGNILLTAPIRGEGEETISLVVADWGIAHFMNLWSDEDLQIMGTPRYLAPELLRGRPPDPRSDMYALGILLYELRTGGVHPLGELSAGERPTAWFERHRLRAPTPITALAPDTPPSLRAVLDDCLSKDPRNRPATAASVAVALEQILEDSRSDPPLIGPDSADPKHFFFASGRSNGRLHLASGPDLVGLPYLASTGFVGRNALMATVEAFLRAGFVAEAKPLPENVARTVDLGTRGHVTEYVSPSGDEGEVPDLVRSAAAAASSVPKTDAFLLSLVGSAGAGKSEIIRGIARRARALGAVVLLGGCRREARGPFSALVDIFDQLTEEDCYIPQEPDATTEKVRWNELWKHSVEVSRDEVSAPDGDFTRQFISTILRLGRRPLLIVIEDLHWIDLDSLSLLSHLCRFIQLAHERGEQLPIRVLFTHRPAHADNNVALAYVQLKSVASKIQTVHVGTLSRAEVLAIVGGLLAIDDGPEVDTFVRRMFESESLPLLVKQRLQLLLNSGDLAILDEKGRWTGRWNLELELEGDRVPTTLQEIIGQQGARLSQETYAYLCQAAILGQRFSLLLLSIATEQPATGLRNHLEEATVAGLISRAQDVGFARAADDSEVQIIERSWAEAAEEWVFVHNRIVETFNEEISQTARIEFHRNAAVALKAVFEEQLETIADRMLRHLAHCGQFAEATSHGVVASRRAARDHAYLESVELFEETLRCGQKGGVDLSGGDFELFGDVAVRSGRYERAQFAYERALKTCGLGDQRAQILLKLADSNVRAGNFLSSQKDLEHVLAIYDVRPPKTRFVRGLEQLGRMIRFSFLLLWPSSISTRDGPPDPKTTTVLRAMAAIMEYHFYSDRRSFGYWALRSLCLSASRIPTPVSASVYAGTALEMAGIGNKRAAQTFMEVAISTLDRQPPDDRAFSRSLLAFALEILGKYEPAKEQGSRSLRGAAQIQDPHKSYMALTALEPALRYCGELASAEAAAQTLADLGRLFDSDRIKMTGLSLATYGTYVSHLPDLAGDLPAISGEVRGDQMVILQARLARAFASAMRREQGLPSEALIASLEEWLTHGFIVATCTCVGFGLAALALRVLDGEVVSAPLRRRVSAVRSKAKKHARRWAAERWLWMTAEVVFELASGLTQEEASNRFTALTDAMRREHEPYFAGVTHRIAARALGSESLYGRQHASAAQAVEDEMRSKPVDAKLKHLFRSLLH